MTVKYVLAVTCAQVPDTDGAIHRTGASDVSMNVEYNAVDYNRYDQYNFNDVRRHMKHTFLCMTNQGPLAGSSNDIPDTDGAIIAARYESTTSSSEGTNSMVMAFEMKSMIRVVFCLFLFANYQ